MMLALAFIVACQDAPVSTDADAAVLVDRISKKPAIYSQSCSGLFRDNPTALEVSAAGLATRSEYRVSTAQFDSLRKVRDGAIKALVAWLEAGAEDGVDDDGDWVGTSRHKLSMLVDLNATAALPALAKLAQDLLPACRAPGAATPDDPKKMSKEELEAHFARTTAAARLSDVLSTIVAIFRQEKFASFLASPLEKDIRAGIDANLKEGWLAEVAEKVRKNGGVVDAKDRGYITHDPVSGGIVTLHAYPMLKIDASMARSIICWTGEYLQKPATKRLDAKGMSAWPVVR